MTSFVPGNLLWQLRRKGVYIHTAYTNSVDVLPDTFFMAIKTKKKKLAASKILKNKTLINLKNY